jgi:UDP-N-acetylmuramoyl-L-alanyl-D-glutamate--2,6-diaminopimelate ligase
MTPKEQIKKFIPKFVLSIYHYKLALIGAFLYGFPGLKKYLPAGRQVKIIGVTGTSGKSTTVNFITKILEESGEKVASISSIRFKIGEKEWENKYKMTMPGRFVIQKFLRQAKKAECNYVVLEVTSEGIKQFRHKFINFDTVVFTNLSKEHLESHGGFKNYRNAKLKLFKENRNTHVINIDDESAKYFLDTLANKKITFSAKNARAEQIKLNLIGKFNIMNALAAVCVAENYGVGFEASKKALEKIKAISGRMEIIAKEPFMVVVDYAHTPKQLESVYKSFDSKPLICVLGSCGGGRDKWKRPVLGEIALKYCKEIIVTDEDPYDEDPMAIIEEVAEGAGGKASKILDRKEAIKEAISTAKPEDVVIITGKGSEPWMCIKNGKKIPWDDRQIARDACLQAGNKQ